MGIEQEWLKRAAEQAPEIDRREVEFFAELRRRQQRLGDECEKVLFDNLWDLYSR
jgi:hypothetical protein